MWTAKLLFKGKVQMLNSESISTSIQNIDINTWFIYNYVRFE